MIFYQSNHDLIEKLTNGAPPLVVCPSPVIADGLRTLIPELNIITISKWTTDHLKTLGLKRSKKSELIIKFGAVWRHYYPTESFNIFYQAFELFTELRSYTLSLDLLSEFFKELDEVVVKSIFIFWAYMDQENIIDEHLGYKKVTESADHKSLSIVGFKHISGVQIDMLKTIGENWNVQVYCPVQVFQESLSNDWMKWIHPDELKKEIKVEPKKTVNLFHILEGKTNLFINEFYKRYPDYDLILAGSNISLHHFQESYESESFFRATEDIFSTESESLIKKIKDMLSAKNGGQCDVGELESFLNEEKSKMITLGNYRQYKMIDLTALALGEYKIFQAKIDLFTVDILEMVINLNSPRVSLVSLIENANRHYYEAGDLGLGAGQRKAAVLATKSIGTFKTSDHSLSEAMINALKTIGPIKRKGLDFSFQKLEMRKTLSEKNNYLLIDESLLEEDLAWREILKPFNISEQKLEIDFSMKKVKDFITPRLKTGPFVQNYYSASRLQTFIDCPQKFYFSYIEKIDHEPDERCSVSPQELGSLEHEVIATYFSKVASFKNPFDLKLHQQICEKAVDDFIRKGKLVLNESEKSKSLNEIMHYSLNGITFLIDLLIDKNGKNIKFEVPLPANKWSIKGFIDCLIELESGKHILLDFKRSEAAAGTKKETLELKKIQLWVYLLVLSEAGLSFDFFGYLNLSATEEGRVLFEGEQAEALVTDSLSEAQKVIEEVIDDLKLRVLFPPRPRNTKVCEFCPVYLTCSKGEAL
jgi:hypothetical protein